MSLTPLEALWPDQPAQQLRRQLNKKQRQLNSYIKRIRRALINLSRQYNLLSAISDASVAVHQNEDITLATMIVICVLSFGVISITSNAAYAFLLTANALSQLLSAAFLPLVGLALTILFISTLLVAAFLQNSLSIALMEGATRKQKRSLISTLRRGLSKATASLKAISLLGVIVFVPIAMLYFMAGVIVYLMHATLSSSLPYLVGLGVISLGWVLWSLANFSLSPYIALFEVKQSLFSGLKRSRQLLQSRGKLFVLSAYLLFSLILVSIYGLAILGQKLLNSNGVVTFAILAVIAVSAFNACLTMLYRRRRLARQ